MYIISLQAAIQIILFLWVVPKVYRRLLEGRAHNAEKANLALGRLCVSFLAVGSLLMGLAPVAPLFIICKSANQQSSSLRADGLKTDTLGIAVALYTCGTGFASAMRAFLTSLVPGNNITTLYTTMALIEGTASIAASPLIGLTFAAGINIGGLGLGLPFFIAAGLYTVAGIGVWLIRPKQQSAESATAEEEDQA